MKYRIILGEMDKYVAQCKSSIWQHMFVDPETRKAKEFNTIQEADEAIRRYHAERSRGPVVVREFEL